MGNLERMLERNRYSELRRRIIRRGMRPLFRASDARLSRTADLSGADIRRILICRPNHRLGNLVLLTPLVIELERTFPDARIDIVLSGNHGAELFRAFHGIGHIYTLSRRMVRHPIAVVRTALRIRRNRYDLAIDPCEASQSGRLLTAIAGARHVIGVPRGQSLSGMQGSAWMGQAPTHMAQWPVFLLRRVVTKPPVAPGDDYPAMDIQLSATERQRALVALERLIHADGESRFRHVIGVFAAATGAKGYDVDWWQRFIRVVEARHPGTAIVEIVPADGQPRLALPSCGSPSPREVAAVIANMTCFVSADCGVMHLASAAGVPTIGLFKASDSLKYAPYGHGSRALDTRGKNPEEVADMASSLIATFRAAMATDPSALARTAAITAASLDAASPDHHGTDLRKSGALS